MSLSYLYNNQFQYQDIPANAIIYRSGTSGFETIQQEQGILMSDGTHYSFGIPTAAELVQNYTGNSIVMTCNNKLVEVPVEGTSPNKLLRQIDGQWKVVDFSVQYIKPELYDPSSWQLWIADNDINVINIPKDSIENNWYGVKYNTELDQFDILTPTKFNISEVYIPWKSNSSFTNIYLSAQYSSYYHNVYYYCSNVSHLIDGIMDNFQQSDLCGSVSTFQNVVKIYIAGGLLIENYNDYVSNASFITYTYDNGNYHLFSNTTSLKNIEYCERTADNKVIYPIIVDAFNPKYGTYDDFEIGDHTNYSFSECPVMNFAILTSREDTANYSWYSPSNYINMYIVRNA